MLKFIVRRYSVRACDSLYYSHATFHLCGGIIALHRQEVCPPSSLRRYGHDE